MPILPWAGLGPKTWVKSQQYCGYTALWNLFNYPVLAIPALNASEELDQPNEAWISHQGRSLLDQFNHDQYDIDLVGGMPVGLLIIAGRFGEEKTAEVAKIIESLPK
jgi:amidase